MRFAKVCSHLYSFSHFFLLDRFVLSVLVTMVLEMPVQSLTVFEDTCNWNGLAGCAMLLCILSVWSSHGEMSKDVSVLIFYREMSGHSCVLCVLSNSNASSLILFVNAFVLDWFVDGLTADERAIDDLGSIAIQFKLAQDFCSTKGDLASDNRITFFD